MRGFFISVFRAAGFGSAGLNLTSCENKTQSTNTETRENVEESSTQQGYEQNQNRDNVLKQGGKTVSELKKEPSLDQIVWSIKTP